MGGSSNNGELERFSSCRGVAFEIQPRRDPFFLLSQPLGEAAADSNTSKTRAARVSILERASSKLSFQAAAISTSLQQSLSRSSSHFCDLEIEDQEDEDEDDDRTFFTAATISRKLVDIEEGGSTDEEKEKEKEKDKGYDSPTTPVLPLPPSLLDHHDAAKKKKKKNSNHSSRLSVILLDQGLFTVYKRLFLLSLTLNLTALVLSATGHFSYARNRPALFSIGNILALSLCRSEAFLRLLFYLAVTLLGRTWVPTPIKTAVTALLQSLGGIHSGCGLSSIAWLVYALVLTLKHRHTTSPEIVGVASAILGLLCLSSLAAFPLVRHLHHNVFERTHRFAGWSALVLLWAFVLLTVAYDPHIKEYHLHGGAKLVKEQEFWFTLAVTVVIILPWLTVRRVPVQVTSASGHASIIKFQGGINPGILGRISPSPLSEWHAFGIISDGKTEHMMLAGAVGDFTKSLVSNPPTHLWVRTVHFAGLPYLVNMYERVVLVATGSGICVFLSFLLQHTRADVYLLWVAKNVDTNFGDQISRWVNRYPKGKIHVHDTAILGRPNVAQLTADAAKSWRAQVVNVTSNPEGSRDVVEACKGQGIPAFGPIWDS